MGMPKILIVEDEIFVGMDLTMQLQDEGYECVGPACSVDAAISLIEERPVQFAILDANLGGESSAPVAERLHADGIPFVYVSGYDRDHIRETLPDAQLIQKPVPMDHLLDILRVHLD